MNVSVELVVKVAAFGVLVLWMVRAGFFGVPRLFSWPMFSRVSECLLDLTDQHGNRINPWQHIVHQDPGMNAWELQLYLTYLRDVHDIRASGTATLIDHTGEHTLTIRDGHVVA